MGEPPARRLAAAPSTFSRRHRPNRGAGLHHSRLRKSRASRDRLASGLPAARVAVTDPTSGARISAVEIGEHALGHPIADVLDQVFRRWHPFRPQIEDGAYATKDGLGIRATQ